MDTMLVRPAPGRRFRFESGPVMPDDVASEVPRSQLYLQGLQDGDLVEVVEEKASARRPKGA